MQSQRRHELRPISRAQVQRIVKMCFPDERVLRHDPLPGVLSNTNDKVQFESGKACLLRVFGEGEQAYAVEANVLSAFNRSQEIPVPALLLAERAAPDLGLPVIVLEWVEGMTLQKVLDAGNPGDNREAGAAVGRTLAKLHGCALDLPHYPIEQAIPFIQQCLFEKGGSAFLEPKVLDRLWDFVREHAAFLMQFRQAPALVHGDFRPESLLMRYALGGWNVATVLDWEFAHMGSALLDLAAILRHEHAFHPQFVKNLLDAYQENGGILKPGWHKAVKIMDLVNQSEKLALRAEQFLMMGEHPPAVLGEEDALIAEAVEIIQQTLDTYD